MKDINSKISRLLTIAVKIFSIQDIAMVEIQFCSGVFEFHQRYCS